jgi:putative spermidine/putrescine transport system ATP-binding protein
MGDWALELDGVYKAYDDIAAVEALDLKVRRGELVTLLGPSGSGKTTTLMMAAGFIEPDRGRIFLDGSDITRMPPQRRNIGVVFQSYALFPHKTVAENVAFSLRMRRVSRAEQRRRVYEALKTVRLDGFHARYPRQLSGGQQQRVALARALVFNPPLLLMDEPLGALDKNLRAQMQLEIKKLQHELSLTIIYVTHDQEEALTLSHRVAVMCGGRIAPEGTPDELYLKPSSAFVARFVGETNLLEGVLSGSDAGVRLVTKRGLSVPIVVVDGSPLGARRVFAIRPERLRVQPAGEQRDVTNLEVVLPATVLEVVYLGDAWMYELDLGAGETVRVKRAADRSHPHFERGSHVVVRWCSEDASLLEVEAP